MALLGHWYTFIQRNQRLMIHDFHPCAFYCQFKCEFYIKLTSSVTLYSGANDGEYFSNTIALELLSGWTGLLVEPIPSPLKKLLTKNRNAWIASCCLSPEAHAMKLKMVSHKSWLALGHFPKFFTGHGYVADYTNQYEVQCYPLHTILKAIGQKDIDYLALDVEGAELAVLKTIPFDEISIKVITVEINNRRDSDVTRFLKEQGYQKIKHIKSLIAHDNVYMRKESQSSLSVKGRTGFIAQPSVANLDPDVIWEKYLKAPRFFDPRDRKLTKKVWMSPVAAYVQTLLKNKTYGFFVEAGANNGETLSNTLPLEVYDGWTGLLVEAHPTPLHQMLNKHRNAWIASCCLSPEPKATKMEWFPKEFQFPLPEGEVDRIEIQCIPLHSLLSAIGQADVDYLSLDLDGFDVGELAVLKTIPFDKFDIKVISVNTNEKREDWTQIPEYLAKYGYKKMAFITNGQSDVIFMKSL